MSVASAAGRTPYAMAARELLRSSLLDAARDLLADRPWADVTMAAIASAAGVSRQTLYNEFGSRDDFARALVLRESERFAAAVEEDLRAHAGDPQAALTAAFDGFLTAAGENPLVRSMAFGGADDMLPLVTTQGRPLVEQLVERLAGAILAVWPQVRPPEAVLVAECLVRLAISFAVLPQGPAKMTGASVSALIGPYVERVFAAR